ncbi:uncharacterized protein FPRO_16002 [Fusarium proliferatum ET1]|uniref:Uncharacterized protein n=1 Tax=Fusarium proliferatum (strain ET1) TaxID=1227346 RepID=A0A1L7WB30_FUSPR|nr:uncharacterized protein FPRO_16002 [Fusarium proliferatum ET1]CZR49793.1 uncharacterized protein FPRO_16002 [Fusarium proliferatum ET1]
MNRTEAVDMARQRDRKFVFWSIHRDPFPEAITPLSRFGRYLLASVLFVVQLTLLVGVPATPSLLAWSTQNQLWLALIESGLEKEAREVLGYLILDTILLVFMIWGAVPVFAVTRMNGSRGRMLMYAAFGGITIVFVCVSIRTMYLTWTWSLLFELAAGDARLVGRCKFISLTLGVLLCLGCASVVIYAFYTARFGTPLVIQQMLEDAAQLLCPTKMQAERRASRQQEQTYQEVRDALPQLLSGIHAREIRVVPNAFNSTPAFLAYFEAAALGSISLVLLDVASAIRRVGASLDAIRSELEIANVARVQGWGHGGFGTYVHRFVQNEMAAVDGTQDGQHHCFYVWHPDSDWYPAFEGRQAEDPLGPAFGGYHHDLATICLRMRADREALIATTDYGRAAVFHLVIPAYYPLVMDHPIAFADELLPLIVTGGRHRGTDLV